MFVAAANVATRAEGISNTNNSKNNKNKDKNKSNNTTNNSSLPRAPQVNKATIISLNNDLITRKRHDFNKSITI